ncbi:MAG: acyl transferase [Ferruginibacter sp.]
MFNSITENIIERIFDVTTDNFDALCIEIFNYQYQQNNLYNTFCKALSVNPSTINKIEQIPFLPIGFFKSHEIKSTEFVPQLVFESSGTTGTIPSRHLVKEKEIYIKNFRKAFSHFYGDPQSYSIIGLLPSYLERQTSSLVYMVNDLVKLSGHRRSGFYLYEFEKLQDTILQNEAEGQTTLLIGVTYALLDFAEKFPMQLNHTIVMETGGMKGRKEEMTREAVHTKLKQQLGLNEVHSEYGMTELLSQAYSTKDGIFETPSWMKILLRATDDPFDFSVTTGAINIIDLANIHSCSFIATDDIGTHNATGKFEIRGRLDNSDIRGCSLMAL